MTPQPTSKLFPHQDRLGWRAGLVLVLLALLSFLPGFFALPPIDRDEPRFAQASKQMVETGDYIDIRFQQIPRYKKPIGIYWLQAGSVKAWQAVAGKQMIEAIWPYRFPSLLAAIASVALTGALGAILIGAHGGFAAGLMMALSVLLNFEARIATTDATLLACVLAAQCLLALAYLRGAEAPPLPLPTLLFGWGAIGLGILVKGPIILLVVLGTIAALAALKLDMRWLMKLRPLAGTALCAAMVAPWLLAITFRSRGAFFQESVGQDLLGKILDGETTGRVPPGFHTLFFWIGFWPASLIVLLALPWVWANRHDTAVRYCLAWIVPTWIVFEIPMTKLPHYVLPAYPALAILGAAWLVRGAPAKLWPAWNKFVVAVWSALTVALCLALVLLPLYLEKRMMVGAVLLCLVALLSLGAAYFLAKGRPRTALLSLLAPALALYTAVGLTFANVANLFPAKQVMKNLPRPRNCEQMEFVSSGYEEPSIVFLTGTATKFLPGAEAAAAMAGSKCTLGIIDSTQEDSFLRRVAELGRRAQKIKVYDGLNPANSKRILLTVYELQ